MSMVASTTGDIYSPFQATMISEDGPHSSEEGSGLHSPVFGAPYGDSFRYQPSACMISPQYDYLQPPMHLVDAATTSAAVRHTFPASAPPPSPYAIHRDLRNGLDFSIRLQPHPATIYAERRLPGGHSQDYTHPRPSALPMESDHRFPYPAAVAPANAVSSPKESQQQRKEISSVVIACRQCRSRKIRCDSARPVCNNCIRRSNDCEYDVTPKRRGPDKRPGTRQRSCKKRPADDSALPVPKRKRTTTTTERLSPITPTTSTVAEQREILPPRVKENMQESNKRSSPTGISRHPDRHPQDPYPYPNLHSHPAQVHAPPSPPDLRISSDSYKQHDLSAPYRRTSYMYDQSPYSTKPSYPREIGDPAFQFPEYNHRKFPHSTSPVSEHQPRVWWDNILRDHTVDNTGHLLSFINTDYLRERLNRDDLRLYVQPSFILAALALAKLMKSSSLEGGSAGVAQAMMIAHDARQAFDVAYRYEWNSNDPTLAEAALVLALFESSSYPDHSSRHVVDALRRLDEVIGGTNLTFIDHADRDVCRFSPHTVPVVFFDSGPTGGAGLDGYAYDRQCNCSIAEHDVPISAGHGGRHHIGRQNRSHIPPWDPNWTADQINNEEVRRLVWSSLTLVSEYIAQCEAFNEDYPNFNLADPVNFGILFPGESLDRASTSYSYHFSSSSSPSAHSTANSSNLLSPKESIWALYCRSMLLWNFCNTFRAPSQAEERAEQAHEAFLEAQAIEDALNCHRCNLDTTMIYMCREYIHNTRMLVAQALRSFHGLDNGKTTPGPIFKRRQAEDWLFYEHQVINRVNALIHLLPGDSGYPAGYQLTRRPFRINWFINQLAICLVLWTHDPTLDDALELAKSILNPIDVLNVLWPSEAIQQRCDLLRQQLTKACHSRNISTPFPPSYSLPAFLRS